MAFSSFINLKKRIPQEKEILKIQIRGPRMHSSEASLLFASSRFKSDTLYLAQILPFTSFLFLNDNMIHIIHHFIFHNHSSCRCRTVVLPPETHARRKDRLTIKCLQQFTLLPRKIIAIQFIAHGIINHR